MTPQDISGTVSAIASALTQPLDIALNYADASQEIRDLAETSLNGVRDGASELSGAESTSAALPIVERVIYDTRKVLAVGAALPLPSPQVRIAFAGANALLAGIESLYSIWKIYAEKPALPLPHVA